MKTTRAANLLAAALAGALLFADCSHVGPKTVAVDRFDDDWQAKPALTAVMFFFTLSETGGSEKLPLITIPAQ